MPRKKDTRNLPSNAQTEKFDMIFPLLDSILGEMEEFAKKKQDGPLNELKVKMINKLLVQVKELLTNDPVREFLDLLDDETVPTNSDAVLIITQYKAAMTQFRNKYSVSLFDEDKDQLFTNRWKTKENP
jgi:hypothetical protein